MGMDILGNSGCEFPVGRFWWREMADYVHHVAPEVATTCKYWYSNDWDGLDDVRSLTLAGKLQKTIDDGSIDRYVYSRFASLVRTGGHYGRRSLAEQERCFAADFVETVDQFIGFLTVCHGFQIG